MARPSYAVCRPRGIRPVSIFWKFPKLSSAMRSRFGLAGRRTPSGDKTDACGFSTMRQKSGMCSTWSSDAYAPSAEAPAPGDAGRQRCERMHAFAEIRRLGGRRELIVSTGATSGSASTLRMCSGALCDATTNNYS